MKKKPYTNQINKKNVGILNRQQNLPPSGCRIVYLGFRILPLGKVDSMDCLPCRIHVKLAMSCLGNFLKMLVGGLDFQSPVVGVSAHEHQGPSTMIAPYFFPLVFPRNRVSHRKRNVYLPATHKSLIQHSAMNLPNTF